MARSTPEEIRRRIAKRKKEQGASTPDLPDRQISWPGDDEKYGFTTYPASGGGNNDNSHPLFRKEVFMFKILASALVFLLVAILFRDHTAKLDQARNMVQKAMKTEFQFASISKWYEDKFGKPLALLPFKEKAKDDSKTIVQKEYAVPASGKILENFEKNGQGIMIETGKGTTVKAVKGGFVEFAGMMEGLGKTVIIQHSDKSKTYYGNLEKIDVELYEYIEKEKVVGTVSDSGNGKGKYYFAIKKGDDFIDPIQVIRFE